MTLPAPNLDDLRFQRDLVDEARKRIVRYCPEWTEYNLSDPGITLIELFAWMTELMVYRMNRVPEKNYIKFLEMLGLQRTPASSATTELTFWLSVNLPFSEDRNAEPKSVFIPRALEVRSESTEDAVVFTTQRDTEVSIPLLTHVRREQDFEKNYVNSAETFLPFNEKLPRLGDTFYLGFDPKNNISGHLLRLEFQCEPTEAVGIRRNDPPWVWECLTKSGEWEAVQPSKFPGEDDTTGGLNNASGRLVLYLPITASVGSVHGLDAFWVRCRLHQRETLQGMYTESPKVKQIKAYTFGATVPAMHSIGVFNERLGISNGEPGQSFKVQNTMILSLQPGETVEVEESRGDETVFVPWTKVEDFSKSGRFDRHFTMDMANGTVNFGTSVRQPNGKIEQYGRIPENGRRIQFSAYRCGGGVTGNLPANSLTTLSTSLAYISRVSNLIRADGGRDQETLDELKLRAQRELQAQRRIVTADDFEQFTKNCSRAVERTHCMTPNDSNGGVTGAVSMLVVPSVKESLRNYDFTALHLSDALQREIKAYLDQYRLMTVSLNIRAPRYIGVKVQAKVVPQDFISPDVVIRHVEEELICYLSPLRMSERQPILVQQDEAWNGWPFGRSLFLAEVISLIQQVPSVKYVMDVEVSSRQILPSERTTWADEPNEKQANQVDKVLRIPEDGLLVSLNHDIVIVHLEEI